MRLYKVFFIKREREKKKKESERDNTLGRFPPLQICSVFLPALLDPRPLLSKIPIPTPHPQRKPSTLHSVPPPTNPNFFFKNPEKSQKNKRNN